MYQHILSGRVGPVGFTQLHVVMAASTWGLSHVDHLHYLALWVGFGVESHEARPARLMMAEGLCTVSGLPTPARHLVDVVW